MPVKFHPATQKWFFDSFGTASPPQKEGWPSIAAGNHTLILAPTGSGKTLAAFLWCIDELFRMGTEPASNYPFGVHTLYVSPLKALNNDIQRNLKQPLHGISESARRSGFTVPQIDVAVRTGDTPTHIRQSMIKKPPHILITTPESLFLMLTSERGREIFRSVRYLILDEIHAMCSNKRGVHLSLSLERVLTLSKEEPVRIGLSATQRPLDRIAAYLGGQVYKHTQDRFIPRPVNIVDCGQKKNFNIAVESPVPDFQDLPEASVWPAVILRLYDLILEHKTTLVFANMRAQSEKIARLLNEHHRRKIKNKNAVLALPHHGSMSREKRYEIEENLKNGLIPAVIATASLELGIDIGSIDLVVQLETPRSVSTALQRIGRSGHLLNQTSKGRFIPLYAGDLDDAAAITNCILHGEIEETSIPENCLDVLAQQIASEVAMHTWNRKDLYTRFRQSYCYRSLSETAFNHVIEMLNGRYEEIRLPALQPRITWDRINDQLLARKGLRLLAVTNGGTIPDRGYFAVYLSDGRTRIGEMEEEFVFESRVGDIFFLGHDEWRIEDIKQDRIIVSSYKSVKPRPPFWKGEIPSRDYFTSQKVGLFREELGANLDSESTQTYLSSKYALDEASALNLIKYFRKQRSATKVIPTCKEIVAEVFTDTAGEKNLMLHTPFGGRINAPWALAIATLMEREIVAQIQYTYNDDGILIRLQERLGEEVVHKILDLTAGEAEQLIMDALPTAPLFAIQFRYNSARALILPRSRPGKRIPLWLQRLRAADLLQAVMRHPEFPIIAETYRSCLEDLFDVPNLLKIIGEIEYGEIRKNFVFTTQPSPMASGLIFNFISNQMYEVDRSRAPGEIASFSSSLLSEIMNRENIPDIITSAVVIELESRLRHEAIGMRARDREDLYEIIEKTGPVKDTDLLQRSSAPPQTWIEELVQMNRIVNLNGLFEGWIPSELKDIYSEDRSRENVRQIVGRYLRIHGPQSLEQISAQIKINQTELADVLGEIKDEHKLVSGKLLADREENLWCDRENFSVLYRTAVARRRSKTSSMDRAAFHEFLLHWHRCTTLKDLINRYSGYAFAPFFLEREIFRSRFGYKNTGIYLNFLDSVSAGELIVQAIPNSSSKSSYIRFFDRGKGSLFESHESVFGEHIDQDKVYNFLKENGASLFEDIFSGTELSPSQIQAALTALAKNGHISTESYNSFLSFFRQPVPTSRAAKVEKNRDHFPGYPRQLARYALQSRRLIHSGRWFLTSSFAVRGKPLTLEDRALTQARMLLDRYGILVKEWYRQEKGLLPWFTLFQALKKMEWQGEIHRGYFVHGLSGIQYAHTQAIKLLEENNTISPPVLISVMDPALPFGTYTKWDLRDAQDKSIGVTKISGNHILFIQGRPVLYAENYGRRLDFLKGFNESFLGELIQQLKEWHRLPAEIRPRKKIIIESIEKEKALLHRYASVFLESGFEKDKTNLVLWPSAV